VSGGTINNFVNGEAGNDQGFFSGGRLSTGLNMGSGNDYVEWSDGRIIAVFDMGADDHAVFIGLNNTDHLGSFLPIQGGQRQRPSRVAGHDRERCLPHPAMGTFRASPGIGTDPSTIFSTLTLGD
jgi:hypothetical protein